MGKGEIRNVREEIAKGLISIGYAEAVESAPTGSEPGGPALSEPEPGAPLSGGENVDTSGNTNTEPSMATYGSSNADDSVEQKTQGQQPVKAKSGVLTVEPDVETLVETNGEPSGDTSGDADVEPDVDTPPAGAPASNGKKAAKNM